MSSWLRSAVNRAVDTDHLIRRTLQSYTDSVVVHAGNAVAGGAKILHNRIGFRNLLAYTNIAKRLEELSVSCRGVERIELLRRWLVLLKQQRNPGFDESKEDSPPPQSSTLVHYADSARDEPKNFRDVFLNSQALEGITLSMIIEAPDEEEVPLVLELYGLCLTGGTEVHDAVMRKVQDLSEAFSGYHEEVLIKRKELLQYARGAIAGLKINADLSRIDAEACNIKTRLCHSPNEGAIDLQRALTEIQLCYKLESVLLKKRSLNNGDSPPPEIHAEKVYKLKILLESLSNSTSKAEKRVLEQRSQKEDALSFRAAKTNEIYQAEENLEAEIRQLETKRDELEAELKKVVASLAGARKRLHHAREERDQFDEANNQILIHLKTKEDEVLRSVASCRAEAEVVNSWIDFLQHTWDLQTSYTERKDKEITEDLERLGDYFLSLVTHLLSAYKESLVLFVMRAQRLVEGLSTSQGPEIALIEDDKSLRVTTMPRTRVEEEYLDVEAKFLSTMSVIDSMRRQLYVRSEGIFRKEDRKIAEEVFEGIKRVRAEFESMGRPTLAIESDDQAKKSTAESEAYSVVTGLDDSDGHSESAAEDINDWEFDALVKD